jgi:hypothetical protein
MRSQGREPLDKVGENPKPRRGDRVLDMRLTTDDLPEIDPVTAADIEKVLGDEVFGKFVILSASAHVFIQAGCLWEPGPESKRFIAETGSEPFRLEYKDGSTGRLYAAEVHVTLDQVKESFLAYLAGDDSWQSRFIWTEFDYR